LDANPKRLPGASSSKSKEKKESRPPELFIPYTMSSWGKLSIRGKRKALVGPQTRSRGKRIYVQNLKGGKHAVLR